YWNPTYSCFTFGKVGLVVTIEEYTTLLRCLRIQTDKAYSRAANDLILAHLDTRKKVDVFVLSIYGLGIFPKYRSRHFIPVMQGLARCEFAYKDDNFKKKVREISNAWNQTRKMNRFFVNPMTTLEYDWWWGKRVNDNVPSSSQEITWSIEEHLAWVAELERSQHKYRSRNSMIELKANLTNIEELKGKIKELEATLQNCEL
ncbi:hypothetical protein Golob_022744, partial [Gossypium lobatum]|nr:hypothetical protein [Gossypium lobatum]